MPQLHLQLHKIIAIFEPKKDINNIRDAKSTIGEDIKNENVAPKGSPADTNPTKIGILEQEQNGVKIPNNAPNIFPLIPLNSSNYFLSSLWWKIRLNIRYYKIITENSMKIFIVSYIKK